MTQPDNTRSNALDALRGYAIMTMVLSAMEAFKVLPRWMYHAQVPPPDHVFNPSIYGITWVDLIFPFFLFSMGAAIPLSMHKQCAHGATPHQLHDKVAVRFVKLTFFAIFCIHMYPFMMGYSSPVLCSLVPILAFLLMFVLFMRNPFHLSRKLDRLVTGAAYVVAIVWLVFQPYAGGVSFSVRTADVIMLILAQVALTGTLLYQYTMHKPVVRAAVIPFIMALFMSGHVKGSWQLYLLDHFTDYLSWLFYLRYQEYLIIIIIGTLAGDLLLARVNHARPQAVPEPGTDQAPSAVSSEERCGKVRSLLTAALSLVIIVGNVVGLYNRWLVPNLIFTVVATGALIYLLRIHSKPQAQEGRADDAGSLIPASLSERSLWLRLAQLGGYCLLLGLVLEAYEGGIRKDDVTLSYLFVTAGLAVLALLFFSVVSDHWHVRWLSVPLELTGRNPMVAYVAGSMFVIPVLTLLHLWPFFDQMAAHPLSGFVRGIILTALTVMVTIFTTKRKWYWKT